jgi:5'-nucleotidase
MKRPHARDIIMDILLTNDDGIHCEGLWALNAVLQRGHAVTVVAPDRERTAVSHGITLHQPLRADRISLNGCGSGYAVTGTPADCVKLGILEILGRRPDLVVSGLNPGANVGVNINYSGTVAAAKEAALGGVPAIAASIAGGAPYHYPTAAEFIGRLSELVGRRGLAPGTFLNVNVPNLPESQIVLSAWPGHFQGDHGKARRSPQPDVLLAGRGYAGLRRQPRYRRGGPAAAVHHHYPDQVRHDRL